MVAVSPDGKTLVSGGPDETVKISRWEQGKRIKFG